MAKRKKNEPSSTPEDVAVARASSKVVLRKMAEEEQKALFSGINLKDTPVTYMVAEADPNWVPPIIDHQPELVVMGPYVPEGAILHLEKTIELPPVLLMVPLRQDGPTLEEWVEAGYMAETYPPDGYAPRAISVLQARQPDTMILSRVDPNPGHIGTYPIGQWYPSKAAIDGGGPGTYECVALMSGEELSREYLLVHPDGRVEKKV